MAREVEAESLPPPPQEPINNEGGGSSSATKVTRVRGRPDPFLVVCSCFSVVTSLAAILCIAVNVLSAVRSFKNGSDVFAGIFRCYAVVIAIVVVVAETEWGFIIKFWKSFVDCDQTKKDMILKCRAKVDANIGKSQVLEYWAGRGMLQIFVAVMTRAYPDYRGERQELVLLQNISCYLLLACGGVYVILGILCIGALKRARQKKEVSTAQAIKDLEELERRREELQSLLLADRV